MKKIALPGPNKAFPQVQIIFPDNNVRDDVTDHEKYLVMWLKKKIVKMPRCQNVRN